jgi:hypothetical protein
MVLCLSGLFFSREIKHLESAGLLPLSIREFMVKKCPHIIIFVKCLVQCLASRVIHVNKCQLYFIATLFINKSFL